jgi:transposase InsO family protein
MWQSDIFCFRLDGRNAYLIGFIDDHSRYIVGRACSGARRERTSGGVPHGGWRTWRSQGNCSTDNGRQYATWRGKTRFPAGAAKDRIHHNPQHAASSMTLGKIERFWRTICGGVSWCGPVTTLRVASGARGACGWKYYNYKRTHQSLDGLVPADRYFAMQKGGAPGRGTGLQENLLELALRGQPKNPF